MWFGLNDHCFSVLSHSTSVLEQQQFLLPPCVSLNTWNKTIHQCRQVSCVYPEESVHFALSKAILQKVILSPLTTRFTSVFIFPHTDGAQAAAGQRASRDVSEASPDIFQLRLRWRWSQSLWEKKYIENGQFIHNLLYTFLPAGGSIGTALFDFS